MSEKIKATHSKSISDKNYTTFLKHFGEFTVAKLEKKEVSGQEYILEELRNLRRSINSLDYIRSPRDWDRRNARRYQKRDTIDICVGGSDQKAIERACKAILSYPGVISSNIEELSDGHSHIIVNVNPNMMASESEIRALVKDMTRRPSKVPPPTDGKEP